MPSKLMQSTSICLESEPSCGSEVQLVSTLQRRALTARPPPSVPWRRLNFGSELHVQSSCEALAFEEARRTTSPLFKTRKKTAKTL